MFEERVVLPGEEILELKLLNELQYSLTFRQGQKTLVEYKGNGKKHSRTVRGRESAYEFKSVEKLRYDFERDARDAERQG
ncbi:MAG: hypothetical protein AABM33_00725 [Pseudomonadota bacterium]